MNECDLGLVGLGVMGRNLALNARRRGYRLAACERSEELARAFFGGPGGGEGTLPAATFRELAAALARPRLIVLLVKAGPPVDQVLAGLAPLLEPGDVIVDGGNSHFRDTERRQAELAGAGIHLLGLGISGGEKGALLGPCLMPGGPRPAYERAAGFFERIAARLEGRPCAAYLGPGGAGHFVKVAHNGIEYAAMQLIAETADLLRRGLGLTAAEAGRLFTRWNEGELGSYLVGITAEILGRRDPESGQPLVDLVEDAAGQKGTGAWATQAALELGAPAPSLAAAVEARSLSADAAGRAALAGAFPGPPPNGPAARGGAAPAEARLSQVGQALYASLLCAFAQGMGLLAAGSRAYGYGLDLAEIARLWRGGSILRARLLERVQAALREEPAPASLLAAPAIRREVQVRQRAWRRTLQLALRLGIPAPAGGAALAYFDGLRSPRLPASLIQAQRDYFGAHTYRRVDREGAFHTDWTGEDEA